MPSTIDSYSQLKDTEANAIHYLLTDPKDKSHRSILHRNISGLLMKTGYSMADIKSLCVHIHTKKDPCGLCTRLIEGFYRKLNLAGFIAPSIKTTLKNAVLVSSCDDYFGGKARSLFWKTDIVDVRKNSIIYDLANLTDNCLFFKLIYGWLLKQS